MIGRSLLVNVEYLRARRLQDLHRYLRVSAKSFLSFFAPGDPEARLRQPELLRAGPIQMHVGFSVWNQRQYCNRGQRSDSRCNLGNGVWVHADTNTRRRRGRRPTADTGH